MSIGFRGGFTVDYRIKNFFVDRQKIEDRARRASFKALGKAGAFLRRGARSRLRRRKSPSMPGNPPSVHSRDNVATLRNILFGVDASRLSMICGPVGLHLKSVEDGTLVAGAVPGTLEFGKTIGIREKFKPFSMEGAIRAFGPRAQEYREEFGILPERTYRGIYQQDFAQRVDRSLGGIWVGVGRKRRDRYLERTRMATYAPRPFMGPTLQAEREKLPGLWNATVSE